MTCVHVMPTINIRGRKVGLGPVDERCTERLVGWANDISSSRTTAASPRPVTMTQQHQVIETVLSDRSRVAFMVYELESLEPIGVTNVFDIDHRHRTCEVDVAIMESDRRGRGLGTETIRLITDYAIHALGMHNVRLCLYGYNHAGYRAYVRAGFREYGRRREAREHNGRRWDVIYMDVIATEWESPVMRAMLEPDPERG